MLLSISHPPILFWLLYSPLMVHPLLKRGPVNVLVHIQILYYTYSNEIQSQLVSARVT